MEIPGYERAEIIGRGTMGTVYRARQVSLDRWVALKILHPGRESHAARFIVEARAAGRLRHPNVISAFDCGEAGGVHFIAMELVPGRSLHQLLRERGPLPEREALDIVRQVSEGLQHALDHGLIHRDIKPRNIMITPEGVAKICDLGLCHDADRNLAGGNAYTPAYVSPEQALGRADLDTRTDLYSLGVTLYRMVTGENPFAGETAREIIAKHTMQVPVRPIWKNPKLLLGTSLLIMQMLEKDRRRRPASPEEVAFRCRKLLRRLDGTRRHVLRFAGR